MAITGIRRLTYGVDDLEVCAAFFVDLGLELISRDEQSACLELRNGSEVRLILRNSGLLPSSSINGLGVHECVWAVDSEASLKRLCADLSHDHELTRDAEGVTHFVTEFGQAIGLEVFRPRMTGSAPTPHNSPGRIERLNQPRKWIERAVPKQIHHTVWLFPDVERVFRFYRDRLNFRLTDVQKGYGYYVRADGAYEHHNLFIADGYGITSTYDGTLTFAHANFEVEDIDELMVGKNYLERCGHKSTDWGFGRHRISSAAFLYLPCPAGGDAEYGADCDAVDDSWKPRIWDAAFGTAIFVHNAPDWLNVPPSWDVAYVTSDEVSYRDGLPPQTSTSTKIAAE